MSTLGSPFWYVLASKPIEMVEDLHGVARVGQGAHQSWQSQQRKSLCAVEASA